MMKNKILQAILKLWIVVAVTGYNIIQFAFWFLLRQVYEMEEQGKVNNMKLQEIHECRIIIGFDCNV